MKNFYIPFIQHSLMATAYIIIAYINTKKLTLVEYESLNYTLYFNFSSFQQFHPYSVSGFSSESHSAILSYLLLHCNSLLFPGLA